MSPTKSSKLKTTAEKLIVGPLVSDTINSQKLISQLGQSNLLDDKIQELHKFEQSMTEISKELQSLNAEKKLKDE